MKLVSEFFYCQASKVMPLRILDNICGVMLRGYSSALLSFRSSSLVSACSMGLM